MDRNRKHPSLGFIDEDDPPPPYSPRPPTTGSSCPPVGYSQHPNPTIPPPGAHGPGVPWPMPATQTSRPSAHGLPPSLHYLKQVNQLIFKKKRDAYGWNVLNAQGQLAYTCTADAGDFIMHIYDNHGVEVIYALRRRKYLDELEVQSPVGIVAGYVNKVFTSYVKKYDIMDASRAVVLKIKGLAKFASKAWDFQPEEFQVLSKDGTIPVGKITKVWPEKIKEFYAVNDKYRISFRMDLDVKIKAVLLGAVFLIHFIILEEIKEREEAERLRREREAQESSSSDD